MGKVKKSIKIHQFDPVIYPRKLWVVITDNIAVINDKFNHNYDIPLKFSDKYVGMVFDVVLKDTLEIGVAVVFSTKKNMTVKNISHESVHVASSIFGSCNMNIGFDKGKDEHYAYLVGWVAECIHNVKINK
jgi:hypothetical protein